MVESRKHFHEELDKLEATVQEMGVAAGAQLRQAMDALVEDDPDLCDAVVAGDDVIDAHYILVERGVVELFALQGPVAMDLRLLATILHVNLHLERIADMAVNIAKITRVSAGLPRSPSVLAKLQEMGTIAVAMLAASLDAFARRDLSLARALPAMDDPLDELNRGMLTEVLADSKDKRMLEWGMQMHVVSRQIERVGDHAVDIAEQAAYLVTGVFQEFTDASHPEIEAGNRLTEAGI
ncbi:MAG TPA: phosphate signaling complex protein PhoU [Actinomycetota bacterium]|nr:phosphate signaling complex protein PhoU [Actinomycetota bacterium]